MDLADGTQDLYPMSKLSLVFTTALTTINFFVVWDDMVHGILPFLCLVCLCLSCFFIGKDLHE